MRKGDRFVSTLRQCKSRSCYRLKKWCRHLSTSLAKAETSPFATSTLLQKNRLNLELVHATRPEKLWLGSKHVVDEGIFSKEQVTSTSRSSFKSPLHCEPLLDDAGRTAVCDSGSQFRILSKHCEDGELAEAVEALNLLVQLGCYLTDSVFYRILKRCSAQKDLSLGRRVHALASQVGYESRPFLANHIIRMYAAHGMLQEAAAAFAKVSAPNNHVWAAILLAHAENGQPAMAIRLYRKMLQSTVKPDNHIFVAVLKACSTAGDLSSGKEVHADILMSALETNAFVGSCLVDMYSKCGSLEDARKVFDTWPVRDVVTWTAMIAGYAQKGMANEALGLYASMQDEGITPTHCTFLSLLKACACVGAITQGRNLHAEILKIGLGTQIVVANSLIDMYTKCGRVDEARVVFEGLSIRDVVTWSAMIAGYVQQGLGQEALALYSRMQKEGFTSANHVTFMWLLKACGSTGALQQGKHLHAQILDRGLQADVGISSNLVSMYAKCGSLRDARDVFDGVPQKHVMIWNALINGYAENSCGKMALQCFEEMCRCGVKPDESTFSCLLVACSHAGLVDEGEHCFRLMEDLGIVPSDYHYTSMVDLLGRSGFLEKAEIMLQTMPFQNDVTGWRALLFACKNYGDLDRGKRCFDFLISLVPESAVPYVLLGNIYASAGRWKDVDRVENLRRLAGAKKKPAKACIEVHKEVHEFTVGEERTDLSKKLRSVNLRLKVEGGYVPQTELVLKSATEQEKQDALCGHAEKLALVYGLLHTPEGSSLLVTKNLRMCDDCHSSTKIMSRLEKREILVRDAHRVHRFLNGSCSCGDRH